MSSADAQELDFWSYIELAKRRLGEEFGFPHPQATELLMTLNRASSVVTYDLESVTHRPRGRSWAAFRLMLTIWIVGPAEPRRIAALSGMTRAAVSNLVKVLVAEGVVDRSRGEGDGRSALLSLTEAGEREMRNVFSEHNEREAAWTDALTEVEQRLLVMLLNKLIAGSHGFDARDKS
ncbi:MarR family winged helix-turn-helix transcriptional regulator [Hoyosella altamirensis]|uniref:MarR family winged helix-turn-helix transcriptional regulator n=1 Tax=Hoyosella altamirensis TaxID=616997 RepID=UPI0007DB323F|nr:MarR family winged helix-turn-helix transcriptional regulator [Hoyosella altamirensis]